MPPLATEPERRIVRHVFPTWSIDIPDTFDETFQPDGEYWHAWDDRRSVSLTSVLLTDHHGRQVPAHEIIDRFPDFPGEPIAPPSGLAGRAGVIDAEQPARASRAISGFLATDGRILVVTITADDPTWAESIWRSIRAQQSQPSSPGPSTRTH